MQWTKEQQPIIHSTANKFLIQAFAGTGKPQRWWTMPFTTFPITHQGQQRPTLSHRCSRRRLLL